MHQVRLYEHSSLSSIGIHIKTLGFDVAQWQTQGILQYNKKGPSPLKKLFLWKNRLLWYRYSTMPYTKAEEYLVASSLAATLDRTIKSMCWAHLIRSVYLDLFSVCREILYLRKGKLFPLRYIIVKCEINIYNYISKEIASLGFTRPPTGIA